MKSSLKRYAITLLSAAILFGVAKPGQGQVVGLNMHGYFAAEQKAVLTGGGFTVLDDIDLNLPITVDTLYLGRTESLSLAQATNVRDYLAGGGCVITEFTQTDNWFNGVLGSFAGTVTDTFFVPSGDVGGGNLVTVTDPADPLAAGLSPTWTSGNPIGVFQVVSGLDAAITTPIMVLGTSNGDLPVAGYASVGSGHAIMFFTDFADFVTGQFTPEEKQLLLNAAACDLAPAVVPEPGALALLMGSLVPGTVFMLRRKRN